MFPTMDLQGAPHKLQRLIDQVERHQLHRSANVSSPREWLIRWLSTPQEALNGRKPAYFLDHEDFDLILVGLLIKLQTAHEWQVPSLTSASSPPDRSPQRRQSPP